MTFEEELLESLSGVEERLSNLEVLLERFLALLELRDFGDSSPEEVADALAARAADAPDARRRRVF